MKVILFTAIAYMVSLTATFGGMGDTREQCDGQYGKPLAGYTRQQLEDPGWFPPQKLAWNASEACVYAVTPTCQVVAWFTLSGEKMICNALYFSSYNPADKLPDKYLTTLAHAIKWSEDRQGRLVSGDVLSKSFIRSDGKELASYMERTVAGRKLQELIIFNPTP